MNIEKILRCYSAMDVLLIGSNKPLSIIICNAQRPQTPDGKPSKWSHCMFIKGPDTVIESTIDWKPYRPTQRRMDNGVQFNNLENYKDSPRAMLMHFPWTDEQRQILYAEACRLEAQGITYPIDGLVGSLLAFWLFPWCKSNPLQGKYSLYCSAFVQRVVDVIGLDFDPNHTANNTSPEIMSQCRLDSLSKIDVSN